MAGPLVNARTVTVARNVLVGTCYGPPDNSRFLEIFKLGLERVSVKDRETLLTVDFNYDL